MLIATHSLVGAAIGVNVSYPPLAFLLGFISHFLLDAIPHCDGPDDVLNRKESSSFRQYLVVTIDGVVAIIAIIYFGLHTENSGFYWGALGGIFPDIIDNVPILKEYTRKIKGFEKFHLFHSWIQSKKTGILAGITIQYAILYAVVLYLLGIF
jgi:hypothetical protein